jgi:hypothetical protein
MVGDWRKKSRRTTKPGGNDLTTLTTDQRTRFAG